MHEHEITSHHAATEFRCPRCDTVIEAEAGWNAGKIAAVMLAHMQVGCPHTAVTVAMIVNRGRL